MDYWVFKILDELQYQNLSPSQLNLNACLVAQITPHFCSLWWSLPSEVKTFLACHRPSYLIQTDPSWWIMQRDIPVFFPSTVLSGHLQLHYLERSCFSLNYKKEEEIKDLGRQMETLKNELSFVSNKKCGHLTTINWVSCLSFSFLLLFNMSLDSMAHSPSNIHYLYRFLPCQEDSFMFLMLLMTPYISSGQRSTFFPALQPRK